MDTWLKQNFDTFTIITNIWTHGLQEGCPEVFIKMFCMNVCSIQYFEGWQS